MTDRRSDSESLAPENVTEDSGGGYGNNADTGGTEAPGEDETPTGN